jgi:hypothetical protein
MESFMSEAFFFPRATETSLADIVSFTGAWVAEGADLSALIRGVAPLDEAQPGELTVLDSPQDAALLEAGLAMACFVTPSNAPFVPQTTLALILDEPHLGFARAMRLLFPHATEPKSLFGTAGVNPGASIHPEARLEQDVIVDPGAVIGPRAEIGSKSIIGANSVIGADVRIGRNCLISPQATISYALIGDRVDSQASHWPKAASACPRAVPPEYRRLAGSLFKTALRSAPILASIAAPYAIRFSARKPGSAVLSRSRKVSCSGAFAPLPRKRRFRPARGARISFLSRPKSNSEPASAPIPSFIPTA